MMLAQTILLIVVLITPLLLAVLDDMGTVNFPNPGRRYSAFYWIVIVLVSGTSYLMNKRRTKAAGQTLSREPGSISHARSFKAAYAVGLIGVFIPLVFILAILAAMIVPVLIPRLHP